MYILIDLYRKPRKSVKNSEQFVIEHFNLAIYVCLYYIITCVYGRLSFFNGGVNK